MHFACRITKATDTLRMCNIYYFSTETVVPRTCFSATLYARYLFFFFQSSVFPLNSSHIFFICVQRVFRPGTSSLTGGVSSASPILNRLPGGLRTGTEVIDSQNSVRLGHKTNWPPLLLWPDISTTGMYKVVQI